MNQKLQLENVGDAATFTITEVRVVSTKFGTKICVVGTDDEGTAVETSLISDTTFDKQLERLDLDRTSVVGERLTFSRAANDKGKPFWNIDVPRAGAAPSKRISSPAAASAPTSPSTLPDQQPRRDATIQHYLLLWDTVAHHLAQTTQKHGMTLSAEAVQSAVATLWISWKDRGIQPDAQVVAKKADAAPPIPTTPPPSGKRLTPEITLPPENPADDDLPFD